MIVSLQYEELSDHQKILGQIPESCSAVGVARKYAILINSFLCWGLLPCVWHLRTALCLVTSIRSWDHPWHGPELTSLHLIMTCNLIVSDFAIGGLHDPFTGNCRTPNCPFGPVGLHPTVRRKATGNVFPFLPSHSPSF